MTVSSELLPLGTRGKRGYRQEARMEGQAFLQKADNQAK